MATYIAVRHDRYLAHYGVKGMRWGVRKDRQIGHQANKIIKREYKNERKTRKWLQSLIDNKSKDAFLTDSGRKFFESLKNKDGSLTPDGGKFYATLSRSNLAAALRFQISDYMRRKRMVYGTKEILGPRTEKIYKTYDEQLDNYLNSKAFKDWGKKYDAIGKELDKYRDIPWDELKNDAGYNKVQDKYDKVYSQMPKGPEINLDKLSYAKLRDIGYNDETSKHFVKKMGGYDV